MKDFLDKSPKMWYNLGEMKNRGVPMREFDYAAFDAVTWDNDIVSLVARIHEFKGRFIEMAPLKSNIREKLLASAQMNSVESSNRIEGVTTSAQRLKQLLMMSAEPTTEAEKEILGYKEAVDTVNRSYQTIETVRTANILNLHATVYSHADTTYGGQFKVIDNTIVQVLGDGSRTILFQPPPSFETPALMERLCQTAGEALDAGNVDPLILTPIFIVDFLCIHPFLDGNGRMSRLLTSLLLHLHGYDVDWYTSIDRLIEQSKQSYYQSLAASNPGWHEGVNDYTPFIKYLLTVILRAYKLFFEMFAPLTTVPSSPFKPLAIDLVRAAVGKKEDKFTKADLMQELPTIGKSSIENALNAMVAEGSVRRHGAARGTYYTKEVV